MLKWRTFSVVVLAGLFTLSQVQAADWGRIASGIAGSYAGAYIADRAGGDTLTQITAGMVGSHLATRAYDHYQSRRNSNENGSYEESGGSYQYSYPTYSAPINYQPSRAEIEREYAQFRNDNAAILTKAKSDLIEKIQSLQNSSESRWICASVCAKFNGYALKATPIATGADQAQKAYDQLNKSCPRDHVFTDGLADNNNGTQTIALKESHLVCFPNGLSVQQAVEDPNTSQSMKMRITVHDVSFEMHDKKTPSRQFIFEALDQLNDPTMLAMTSGQASVSDIKEQAQSGALKEQLALLNENMGPASRNPRDGSIVMESKPGTPSSKFIRLIMKPLSSYKVQVTMDIPMVAKHKCGEERGRITISSLIEVKQLEEKAKMSDRLVQYNMQAAGFSSTAVDEFCKTE